MTAPVGARRLARLVDVVQWIVGVGAGAAVVMLFTLSSGAGPSGADTGSTADDTDVGLDAAATAALIETGRPIYGELCATCHGIEGQGGVGPPLGDVVRTYPDPEAQAVVVATGRGTMPAFAGELTVAEIQAVVAYTRAAFG